MPNFLFLTPPQSPDIGENSDGVISHFRISGQAFIKRNFHNSKTSDDIDMKLGSVAKLDKRNKATSKNFDYDLILENCEAVVIFPIIGQFGAIRKPDIGRILCKTYIFIDSMLLSPKN